jgi:hypothetical protein
MTRMRGREAGRQSDCILVARVTRVIYDSGFLVYVR